MHNRDFVSTIDPAYHDWIVTAVFYTAIHAVDSLLAHDNIIVTNHDQRRVTLMRTNRYLQIYKSFEPLYGLCRTIRYLADPLKWVPYDRIETAVIKSYLYPIEASVQKLTGNSLNLQPILLRPGNQPNV